MDKSILIIILLLALMLAIGQMVYTIVIYTEQIDNSRISNNISIINYTDTIINNSVDEDNKNRIEIINN